MLDVKNMNLRDLKVVFAGCARDCSTYLPTTIENIKSYSKLFKDSYTLIVENGSKQDIHTREAPTDCLIVTYEFDGETHQDLTRGTRVSIFDMYYDKFKNGLKKIDYGYGTVKPNLWGYQTQGPKKKKRK